MAVSRLRGDIDARLQGGDDPGIVAWLAGDAGIDRGAAEQTVAYLASHARDARRGADAGHAGPRTVLRRIGRHAARAARAVRQPHQQGVGPRAAQAVLPSVQLRAAGRGDRGCAAPVARARSTRFRSRTSSATCTRRRSKTCSCRPCSTRRCSRRGGAGTRRSRSRSRGSAAAARCRLRSSACSPTICSRRCFPTRPPAWKTSRAIAQLPDHPLVGQTVRDCLEEAMDVAGLSRILTRIHAGDLRLVTRDTPEPSPLSHEILNAKPYAFLDDAPLEERRTQAVYARRASEPASGQDLGALDASAIARVRDEERPDPRDADELHDALITAGFLSDAGSGQRCRPICSPSSRTLEARRALVDAAGRRHLDRRRSACRSSRPFIRAPPHGRDELDVPAAGRLAPGRATRRSSSSCAAGCRWSDRRRRAALAASLAIAGSRRRRGAARARV